LPNLQIECVRNNKFIIILTEINRFQCGSILRDIRTMTPTMKAPRKYGGREMWKSSCVYFRASMPLMMSSRPRHSCSSDTRPYARNTHRRADSENTQWRANVSTELCASWRYVIARLLSDQTSFQTSIIVLTMRLSDHLKWRLNKHKGGK